MFSSDYLGKKKLFSRTKKITRVKITLCNILPDKKETKKLIIILKK